MEKQHLKLLQPDNECHSLGRISLKDSGPDPQLELIRDGFVSNLARCVSDELSS